MKRRFFLPALLFAQVFASGSHHKDIAQQFLSYFKTAAVANLLED